MTLPFTIIYVHEVRGIPLDVAGLLMSLIGVVALVVTGPVGALIDRLGSARGPRLGQHRPAGRRGGARLRHHPAGLRAGVHADGHRLGVGWPGFNALTSSIV